MRHNSLNVLLACCLMMLLAGQSVAAGVSVAFVHTARLLNESPQITTLKRNLSEDFEAREKRLTEMQMQIKMLQEKLEKESARMSSAEQRRLKHDITTRRLKYKHARDELTQDKQLRYSEEEERVTRIIREVIQQVAQDDKIDIVLQSGVLWVAPEVDITDKVLMRLRELAENGN